MSNTEEAVRGRILQAAVDLLREARDADRVSIRAIAERAQVSVGMANYHFQTKDNLIEAAVQSYIAGVIHGTDPDAPPAAGPAGAAGAPDAAEGMRRRLRAAARFVAEHPGISRVSILRDLKNGHPGDNSSDIAEGVCRQLAGAVAGGDETTLRLLAEIQVAAVQHLFLRAAVYRETVGFDFFDERQRDRMMDLVVDTVLGAARGGDRGAAEA